MPKGKAKKTDDDEVKAKAKESYKKGNEHWDEGNIYEAYDCFNEALSYDPEHEKAKEDLNLVKGEIERREKQQNNNQLKRTFNMSRKDTPKKIKTTHQTISPSKQNSSPKGLNCPSIGIRREEASDNNNFNKEPISKKEGKKAIDCNSLEASKEEVKRQEGTDLNSNLQSTVVKIRKEFEPKIPCSQIKDKFKFSNIKIEDYIPDSPKINHNKNKNDFKPQRQKTSLSKAAKSSIGEWGETFVYYKLKSDYGKNYSIEETPSGSGFKGTSLDKTKSLELIWHFRNNQPRHLVDFTITEKNGVEQKMEYIEVKSTPNNKPSNAKFTGHEIDAMRKYGSQYKILRLYNIGNEFSENTNNNVRIKEIKNPREKIFSQTAIPELGITSIKLKI